MLKHYHRRQVDVSQIGVVARQRRIRRFHT